MKRIIIWVLLIAACSVGMSVMFTQQRMPVDITIAGETISPQYVIVDDYKGDSTYRNWYYSRIGTDRGAMGEDGGSYTVEIGGGSASVNVQSGWAGVWTALIHKGIQNEEINPTQLLGPYIKAQYQPYISGIEVDIVDGLGQFKIELKDGSNGMVAWKFFYLAGGEQTLEFSVTPATNISKLNWLVNGAGYAEVDEVRLVIQSPDYSVPETVFLFTYGHLCQCYDEESGLVRDRARWPVEDFAAVQTTGTFALATAIAWNLGYVEQSTAAAIIQKTKTTILNLPRHEKGLLPHFVTNGDITENTEWSSVDTAITLIAEILACQAIGEDTSSLETLLENIDWQDLTDNGSLSISMGYSYDGQKLQSRWDTFGSESLLAAIAYCASSGDNNVKLQKYKRPPTWDGSGFNDEMAALFFPTTGTDIWGNNWSSYREQAFKNQYNHLFIHNTYEANGLFGLSASEVPEPWTLENEGNIYKAWGIGGHNHTPNDGVSLVGYPIIAPHYAAMIAAENPGAFETLFLYLIDTHGIFTPLNNVESFGAPDSGNVCWNSLKGSWNLSLQVLGAGRALSNGNYLPYQALGENNFLNQGFIGIMGTSITITFPNGDEDLEVGTTQNITWNSSGIVGNVKIEYSTNHGNTWTEIVASTENDGTHPWTVPGILSNRCLIRVSETDGSPWDISDGFFKIFQPAISITSPDGGEVWVVGTQKNITWDNIGTVGAVKIEYSTDNGDQWIEIVAAAENEGLYPWTIPDTVSNLCLVRVSEIDGTPFDESNNVFSIASTPSIIVLSPNGGETLYVGAIKNITWTSTGTVGNVKIRYSTNNGDQWTEIIASTENDGSYPWTIPGVASNQCLVEVSETDGSPLDTSDNVFSIEYTPTITVTSPNGGENLDVNSNHTITWNTEGNVGNVMIQYSVNGGTKWDTIAPSTENDGSFNWTVPDKPSDNCLVRISAGDPDSGLSDTSDDVFSIVSPSLGSITVTSPNGGEKWFVGSTHEIKWTAEGIDKVPYVTIEYSINRGNTWFTIVSSAANASNGVFNWTVPNTPSDKCIVRVRGVDEDNAPSDTSNGQFSIRSLPSPSIVVTAPNGGETWMIGDQRTISWETTGSVGYVTIDYSIDSGDNWSEIIQSTENDGSYDWTVADTASDYCLVRVSDADSGGQPSDTSDAVFSIVPPPSITVTSPNGGEQWQAGSSQIITWNSTGIVGNLLIEYSIDGSENWIEISAHEPNNGSYNWSVPDPPSDDCLVRISTTDTDPGDGISDVSDAVFSITETQAPSLTVTYPNGGELLFANATYEIKWTSIGTVDNVAIHYSTNGGETWSEIIQSTENDGSHDWTVPETDSDNCLVRVRETDGNPVDISDAVFSIAGPTTAFIRVTTPNGGETWLKGSSQEIKWTSTGTINSVSIDYSLDNGTTWAAITASTPNDGSFEWTVPDTPSDDCLVRIIGTDGDWDEVPSDTSNDVFSIITSILGAVKVVFPNGGETWEVGSMQEIAWNSSGNFDRVNIEYSPNSGGTWLTIIESYDDTGTYDWEVPDKPSDYCLVRIVAFFSESDDEVSDISDDFFSIVPPTYPTITVETPNGGELLYIGYLYDITWTSTGEVGEVTIEYSSNGGNSWEEIIASTENDGYFEWTVPDDPSESALVRISEVDGSPLDVSNAVFGIGSPPSATVEVKAPNGGETLDAGSEYQIAWDSTELENVSIEYSTNNGVSWSFVTYAPAAEGVYTWIVPGTDSDNCLVRVSGSDSDENPSDVSDAVFSIVQPVQASVEVLTPNGGESLGVGGEYNITWISTGVQEVLIEYSYNNGESWEEIDTADAAGRRYTWTVPNTPSEICRVRISGNDGGQNPTDVSDAVFSIIADSP